MRLIVKIKTVFWRFDMKKLLIGIAPLIMLFSGCAGSSKTAPGSGAVVQSEVNSGGMTLDQSIAEAAARIEERIAAGSKIAPLNFNSASDRFSSYVLDELTANLVDSRKLIVVDRKEVDLIRSEFDFQYSGEVGDDSMQALGRMLGAQSIISGSLTDMGGFYRIVIRVLNVQNASVEVQYRANIVSDHVVTALLAGGRASVVAAAPAGQTPQAGQAQTQPAAQAPAQPAAQTPAQPAAQAPAQPAVQASAPVIPPLTGALVPGTSLTEKLAWLQRSADSHNTYILELNADENIAPHIFEYSGAINITIVLRGNEKNRTIRLRSHGAMFTVRSNVTFVLENNITLQGHSGNNNAVVYIEGGNFRMNGGAVSGNANVGVLLDGGTFTMNGGAISDNTNNGDGGGVRIREREGTFTMNNGTISGNTASRGGGVYVPDRRSFTMSGGTISGNTAKSGGGVYLVSNLPGGTFTMRGGTITGNTANESGGGVYVVVYGKFTKTGGTITGYNSDQANGNAVRDEAGNILARKGHAVYMSDNKRKETTAGPGVNLSNESNAGWDN
jgi:TolB-like protein